MKKICHITTVHPPFDVRIFQKECKTLVMRGYSVILIVPQGNLGSGIKHDKRTNAVEKDKVDGIKIIYLPKTRNRLSRILFLARKAYRIALKQKANIYHFHDPEFLFFALKLKKRTDAKIIYDVHEDVPQQILSKYWIPFVVRKPISFLFNCFEKKRSKKLDYIITATPSIKKNFKQNGVTDIKNYPITSSFLKREKVEKIKKGYTELIYVGGLSKERGIKEVIQSLKYVNPKHRVRLKLIGKFSEESFEEEIKIIPEWKKVDFLGFLPQKEVYENMKNADIGIVCMQPLPRYIVSLPIKMFEYMVSRLPVISSNFPTWEKIIEENKCGVCVNPADPQEISKAVEYLIEHSQEAKEMGENGRRAVLEKYNWEEEGKKLLEIYEGLSK